MEVDLGKLSAIIITDDGIGDSQAMDVSHNAFQPLSTGIVSDYHSCVSHQLGWKIYITTQFRERIQSHIQENISLKCFITVYEFYINSLKIYHQIIMDKIIFIIL